MNNIKKFYFGIIAAIILYGSFLIFSDYTVISNKISNFKFEFLPHILFFITFSWFILYFRWVILLKNIGIHIEHKENVKIYFAAFALSVTPGKVGDLIKSQLLKNKFGIPRTRTAPIVFVERIYDLVGAVIVSSVGAWMLGFGVYVIIISFTILLIFFLLISSRTLFKKTLNIFSKIKFLEKFVLPLSESYETIRTSSRGKIIIWASGFSIIFWLVESVGVYFVLLALDFTNIPYPNLVAIYVSSLILGAVSFIPGGLGVTEGSLIGLFNLQGIEFSEASILTIFIRFFTLWYTVAVGFIFLKLSGGLSLKSS